MPLEYAYAWRSGLIEFGSVVPEGAIEVAQSMDIKGLRDAVTVCARHGYDGQLLVPGVPEASDGDQATDALCAWLNWSDFERRLSANSTPPLSEKIL